MKMKQLLPCLKPLLGKVKHTHTNTHTHTHTHANPLPICVFIKRSLSHFSLSSAALSFSNFSGVIANWCELGENLPPRCCLLKTSWNKRGKRVEGAKRKMERWWRRRRWRREVGSRGGGVYRLRAAVKSRADNHFFNAFLWEEHKQKALEWVNDFIVLLEGNKEVYSGQVKEKGEELRNSKTERES